MNGRCWEHEKRMTRVRRKGEDDRPLADDEHRKSNSNTLADVVGGAKRGIRIEISFVRAMEVPVGISNGMGVVVAMVAVVALILILQIASTKQTAPQTEETWKICPFLP